MALVGCKGLSYFDCITADTAACGCLDRLMLLQLMLFMWSFVSIRKSLYDVCVLSGVCSGDHWETSWRMETVGLFCWHRSRIIKSVCLWLL